jgi:uncharacterized cofD-like protein
MINRAMDQKNKTRRQRISRKLASSTRWFIPGIGVKRWFILILLGITLLSVGIAVVILDVYRTAPETWWLPVLSYASLRFLARPLRAVIFGGLGLGLVVWGILELNRSLVSPFLREGHSVADTLWSHRQRGRGPRIVAIGGGHGLATLLRGMKQYTYNLTAIVTVADDGGSSGRLRRDLGILPPGDIRNCLAALSDDEALMAQLFQYRFPDSASGLDGHPFGNLFISALADITGSFEEAVVESGKVLAVQGQVLPSTLHDVKLMADVALPQSGGEVRIHGESQIPNSPGKVRRVWLEPNNPPAYPQAIKAILTANLIVIGPGSLYTSILPNLLVPELAAALRASRAMKIYVCNVATQRGETDGYTCGDHIRALEEHLGGEFLSASLVNNNHKASLPNGVEWVILDDQPEAEWRFITAGLVDEYHPWRHDSRKLSQSIMELYQEWTGPLVE